MEAGTAADIFEVCVLNNFLFLVVQNKVRE